MESMPKEFEIIATFSTWLKILPELKNYNRVLHYDKGGHPMYYFKLK